MLLTLALIDFNQILIHHLLTFQGVKFLEGELTREELAVGALLYKLQLGCTHNVHLIYRLAGDVSGGIPLDMVGSAVYQNCVLLNHSCAANTTRLFQVIFILFNLM